MSQKRLDPGIALVSGIGLIVVGLVVFVLTQVRTDEISARINSGSEIPVLVMVEHQGKLILSHVQIVHPKTGRIAMVDIPLNLGQIIGSLNRVDSLDALYNEKGPEPFVEAVSRLLDMKLPFWVRLNTDDVRGLTDFLGGLPVFIADSIDEQLEDGSFLRIPSGSIVLDGDKVVDFLVDASAHPREQERANRRWVVSRAILEQISRNASHTSDPVFMGYLARTMHGNMDERTLRSWCEVLGDGKFENILNQRIMGNTRTVEMDNGTRDLLFPHLEGQLIKEALRQVISNLASADLGKDGRPIQLEILNGTELPGIARKARDLYVNYGFEVVRIGNAATTETESTQVIDRTGNVELAQKAAGIIRCENVSSQMITQSGDEEGSIDVTVILGKDFDGWYVKK